MPNKTLMPLRQFNIGDGRVGTPGTPVENVPEHVAHAAEAFGNAKIITDEEAAAAAKEPPGGDEGVMTTDRDPKVRKR